MIEDNYHVFRCPVPQMSKAFSERVEYVVYWIEITSTESAYK